MNDKKYKMKTELEEIKKKIRNHWDEVGNFSSEPYDGFPGFDTEEEKEEWRIFLSSTIGGNKRRILDVGTGAGFLSLPLAEMGHDVVGIDLSEAMLSGAIRKAKEREVNLDLRMGDAESLDFHDKSFDVILSRWVLWTLPNPEKAVKEWKRVLNPGGYIYAFTSKEAERKSAWNWIKTNLGRIAITVLERRNAWAGAGEYDDKVKENLPLGYDKAGSEKKVELFKTAGFKNVTVFNMEKVNKVHREKLKERPLRYKLTWSGNAWCCVSGRKPEA